MQSKKEKRSSDSPLFRWQEEMLRHLVAILESFTSTQKIDVQNIVQLINYIYIDQTRAPWPGSLLSAEKKESWRQFLERNSKILLFVNSSAAFSEFASKISSRLLRELSAAQIASTLLSNDAVRDTQVEHMIRQEFYSRGSAVDTVARSVQRYLKADAKTRRERAEIKMSEGDPMRDLLDLPRIGRPLLAHEDVRVHLARYLNTSAISKHLQRASAFATPNMETVLGKDLSALCKPVGFADQHRRILLIEVSSAAAVQELTFNKSDIIIRLKNVPGLETIQDLRFRFVSRKQPRPV